MGIEGQIASIVDESALIINRGAKQGVKAGMRFAVFAEVEDVKDPDSGETLGKWELVKGVVAAAHVQEKMTVCAPIPPEAVKHDDTHTLSYDAEDGVGFLVLGRTAANAPELPRESGAFQMFAHVAVSGGKPE